MRCISRLFAVLALIGAIGFMGAPARAQTETALYAFTGKTDGEVPIGGVVRDKKGNLYGVTARGGNGNGVVFKVDKTGRETVLLTFGGGNAGAVPQAGLIMDKHGNLYGTTYFGGTNNFGVVFKVDASGNESVLHMFAGNEGANPIASLTMDKQGNLYGTVTQGCAHAYGGVFKIDTSGNYTLLYSFANGSDGASPYSNVVLDKHGNIYGTTSGGGPNHAGTIYKIDAAGNETVLYTFTGASDGNTPLGNVAIDKHGNIYGTTSGGGTVNNHGVVFMLSAGGEETVIHTFTGGTDGAEPLGGVSLDKVGNVYGTTAGGGIDGGYGVVFGITTAGQFSVLYSFTGGADGGSPNCAPVGDKHGNLYGTTGIGGNSTNVPGGAGVVWRLAP